MAGVELQVLDAKGSKVGSKAAAESVVASPARIDLLHEAVRWQRSKRRAGTHTVLTRSEVRGGGAKPWRQKGTGRARAGSASSPVWVKGGVAHGPKQRDYGFTLNKKARRKALCTAISARVAEGKCVVVKDLGLTEIKAKQAAQVLAALGIDRGVRTLVVLGAGAEIENKSLRNLPRVKTVFEAGVNVYDILNAEYLVFTEAAFDAVHERLNAESVAS